MDGVNLGIWPWILIILLAVNLLLLILLLVKLSKTSRKDDLEIKPDPLVGRQLVNISEQIGELKGMTSGVEDLQKIISNVKTRGIFGETQLEALLADMLHPEQYEKEVSTLPNSKYRVEFAVRLPGNMTDGRPVYLPIDAKFPADAYVSYLDAKEEGDAYEIDSRRKLFDRAIRKAARDINEKYVSPPYTTNFAIMFLPFESLYIEVLKMGLAERIQQEYRVAILGPSNLAAFLNSLQMGFQTLAIEKKADEVWETLKEVRRQFELYQDKIDKVQDRLRLISKDLDETTGRRTRAILRSLKDLDDLS